MKKKIVAILACAMMLLSAGASAEMTAGTYTGEGQGVGGAVKVAVTVENNAITAVEVVEHSETAGISDPAIERVPAAIVANQSLAVDTVTGATMTSKAILAAAEQALAVDPQELDGLGPDLIRIGREEQVQHRRQDDRTDAQAPQPRADRPAPPQEQQERRPH